MTPDDLIAQLEHETRTPSHVCALRKRLILKDDAEGLCSLASFFVNLLATPLDDFCFRVSENHAELPIMRETKQLQRLLGIHSSLCRNDDVLAEELGREGTHVQLVRIIQLPIDEERMPETSQDTVMELQDMACSIAAMYQTFPMRVAPLTMEELQQRLPLEFEIAPTVLDEHRSKDSQTECILIHQVTKRQSAQEDVGYVIWPSAVVLARWLANNTQLLKDPSMLLEIGAGCGFVGLLVARMQQRLQSSKRASVSSPSVILSDFNPSVLENLRRNIALNNVSDICTTVGLDFYQQPGHVEGGEGAGEGWVDIHGVYHAPVDILLGADIICQTSDAVAASRTIHNALRPGGFAYIVCATSAHRFGVEAFPKECIRMGLKIQVQSVASLYNGSLLTVGLEKTTGYIQGMEMTMFTIEKPLQ